MKKNLVFALTVAIIITSCSNGKEKDRQKILELEKTVLSKTTLPFDIKKSKELVDAYIKFAEEYPSDTGSVNLLFKAATISMNIGKGQVAVDLFNKIIKKYPDYKKNGDCMFLKAFVYDDKLKELNKARDAYMVFIKKYPDHEFADDAQACIENLGKTPEQLFKEFEAKNNKDTVVKN